PGGASHARARRRDQRLRGLLRGHVAVGWRGPATRRDGVRTGARDVHQLELHAVAGGHLPWAGGGMKWPDPRTGGCYGRVTVSRAGPRRVNNLTVGALNVAGREALEQ